MASAHYHRDVDVGWADDTRPRLSVCAIYIYLVLGKNLEMYILGISAFYHDSAACLLKHGEIVAAAQEERFTRMKHDAGFPRCAVQYCVQEAQIDASEIHNVVFYEKPFVKFERLLETYLAFAPKGFSSFTKAIPVWVKDKLFQKAVLIRELGQTLDSDVNW